MRPEKAFIVRDMQAAFDASPFAIVADFSGLKVSQFSDLRSRLAGAGARCQVVKNTFLRRAAADAGLPEEFGSHFTGQSAIVTGEKDVAAAAKILRTFATETKKFAVRAGVLENKLLSKTDVEALADLPSKESLQSQFLGLLLAPATQVVRLLNEPGSMLARVLQARLDKAPAEAPEAPAESESAPEAVAA